MDFDKLRLHAPDILRKLAVTIGTLATFLVLLWFAATADGCRATVPVVQINSTMTCTVTGGDAVTGTVQMDCRQNGHKANVPVTAPGDGPTTQVERKTSALLLPHDARLN